MGKARYRLMVVGLMAGVLIGGVPATYSQPPSENCDYFTETGHYVCGEFLEFFETQGGLGIFGYPLTEAFDDLRVGLPVQYFQRARMELHPHTQESYKVLLGPLVDELADELGYHFPPVSSDQIPPFSSLHRYFPETGHIVSYAFLDYFREHGGWDIFGYPRSEFMVTDGCIVQYFQRARMEWHPEAPPGQQMRLTNLGEIYLERFGVPGNYDEPRDPPGRIYSSDSTENWKARVRELNISASVRHIITGQEGVQTVFVYVVDQWQQPVEGAAVRMVVHYQSNDRRYEFAPSDKSGFTRHNFDILSAPPGRRVVIDVTATHGNLTGATQTFFLPWW